MREHLGERFAFIEIEEVNSYQCFSTGGEEGSNRGCLTESPATKDRAHRLTYYSYSYNSAIHVCLQGNQITSFQCDPRQGYQPPEGPEEVEQAITLAETMSALL